ncbi:hypothetical protein GCM10011386_40670 [Parapedobacter defluvii]|uniref:JmjC domain-containing protein n=1 Tax=Parapedobacter defluvii TaxID=2045106 RepID=A0ABQ1MPI0_9SPHI|nr:cupin-like domain-containing protein [Parapedobacter defluvii]RQP08448.1 MAG: cupin-like domain-containing protein [Parapedobacter sp.]GGC44216.1 hypothetical protein GCM10011386_40670 [Parapedobacter defluvii]
MQLKKVEKISGISSADFIKNYLNKGVPVILDDFVSKDSPAWKKWSYDYFKEIAGDTVISLHGREDASNDRAASAPVAKMKFSEYLDLIEREPTDLRIFLFNLMKLKPELNHDLIYNDVTGGKVLQWLPYLFFGGEGSSTRNHFDIDMSHVFITQYKGVKRIWLFPLEQSDLMYKLPYNFHSIANIKNPDYEKFPALKYLDGYEAEIHPGETLFMPSGWWHYIQYVTEGYSISVRALPSKVYDKWRGFRNLVITRNFDNTMRKIFKDRWFNYKINAANKRAEKALKRVK